MNEFGSCVILAGGRSTRMGFDKQLLAFQGKRIMQHLIQELSSRFSDIMISTRTPELYLKQDVRVIEDIYEDMGPLGGIHAALKKAKTRKVFAIACDMPYVEIPYIDFMKRSMEGKNYDACVTEYQGRIEPFHAFYSRTGLPVLEDDLDHGKCSIYFYTRKINTLLIPEVEAVEFLPGWRAFTNLNTRQEYERFRLEGA